MDFFNTHSKFEIVGARVLKHITDCKKYEYSILNEHDTWGNLS